MQSSVVDFISIFTLLKTKIQKKYIILQVVHESLDELTKMNIQSGGYISTHCLTCSSPLHLSFTKYQILLNNELIVFCFFFFFKQNLICVKLDSLTTQQRMTLDPVSSCLPLSSAGVSATQYYSNEKNIDSGLIQDCFSSPVQGTNVPPHLCGMLVRFSASTQVVKSLTPWRNNKFEQPCFPVVDLLCFDFLFQNVIISSVCFS